MKYDDSEALRLLGDFSEGIAPATTAAEAAASQLLDAVMALKGSTNVVFERNTEHPAVIEATINRRAVWLKHMGGGQFAVFADPPADYRTPVTVKGLKYNPTTKMIEGEAEKESDIPFRPPVRRGALAIVVEAVIAELRKKLAR